jgi:hypothetical protein
MRKLTLGLLLKEVRDARRRGCPHKSIVDLATALDLDSKKTMAFVSRNKLYEVLDIAPRATIEEKHIHLVAEIPVEVATPVLDWIQSNLTLRGEHVIDIVNQIRKNQGKRPFVYRHIHIERK